MRCTSVLIFIIISLPMAQAEPGVQYQDPIGERFASLLLFDDDRIIRSLSSNLQDEGTFDAKGHPYFSEDKKYLLFNQINSGQAEFPDGTSAYHEVVYCGIINTSTGCLIARETGEFCAGEFTAQGKWESSIYPDFDLEERSPKATNYLEQRLKPSESPVHTLENLMLCDPPREENISAYNTVITTGIFKNEDHRKLRLLEDLDNLKTKKNK